MWYLPLGNATAPCVVEPGAAGAVERPGVVGASTAAAPAAVIVAAAVVAAVVVVVAAAAAVAATDVTAPGVVESGVAGAEGRADGVAARGLAVPRHDDEDLLVRFGVVNDETSALSELLHRTVASSGESRGIYDGGKSDRKLGDNSAFIASYSNSFCLLVTLQ